MDNELTLGQTIRAKRKELGLTIKELSTKVGLSEQAISQYELDKRTPDEATLINVASALKTSALSLLASAGKDRDYILSFYDTAIAFVNNMEITPDIESKLNEIKLIAEAGKNTKFQDIICNDREHLLFSFKCLLTNYGVNWANFTDDELIEIITSSSMFDFFRKITETYHDFFQKRKSTSDINIILPNEKE